MKIEYLLSLLFLITTTVSCSHHHDNDRNHDHENKVFLTSYNNEFEVFAEADPFTISESSKVVIHITKLKNFKPLGDAKVSATLIVGSSKVKETVQDSEEEGIFTLYLTPRSTGKGLLTIDIETDSGLSQATVDDIEVFNNKNDAQHAAHDAHPESSNGGIDFSKEQSWKVGFATQVVERTEFGQVIKTTAQIQPSTGDERVITAKTDGIVIFQDNQTVPGRTVGAGQRLFYIDASQMADNNLSVRLQEAESEYNRAKIEYERKEKLAKDNIISQSELLQAKTELSNAQANIESLKRNFTAGKQSISSPISGFVTDVLVQNGQFVSAGQPVLRVSQNKNLFIKAELQPKYYNLLTNISTATIRVPGINQSYSLEDLNGNILSFGRSSDMSNPLIPVIFQVNNSIGLLPGSFVDIYIKMKSTELVVTVPNEAIVEEMGAHFVMVQLNPEYFEKRAIEKGATDGIRTHVISGINENERIVSKGAIFVKIAQEAGGLDAHSGHFH